MRARPLFWALVFSCLCWMGVIWTARAVAAPGPKRLAPPWVCTMANRLEVFVDEDQIMYECACQVLATGFICKWEVVGSVEATSIRRNIRHRYHWRYIPTMHLVRI